MGSQYEALVQQALQAWGAASGRAADYQDANDNVCGGPNCFNGNLIPDGAERNVAFMHASHRGIDLRFRIKPRHREILYWTKPKHAGVLQHRVLLVNLRSPPVKEPD